MANWAFTNSYRVLEVWIFEAWMFSKTALEIKRLRFAATSLGPGDKSAFMGSDNLPWYRVSQHYWTVCSTMQSWNTHLCFIDMPLLKKKREREWGGERERVSKDLYCSTDSVGGKRFGQLKPCTTWNRAQYIGEAPLTRSLKFENTIWLLMLHNYIYIYIYFPGGQGFFFKCVILCVAGNVKKKKKGLKPRVGFCKPYCYGEIQTQSTS